MLDKIFKAVKNADNSPVDTMLEDVSPEVIKSVADPSAYQFSPEEDAFVKFASDYGSIPYDKALEMYMDIPESERVEMQKGMIEKDFLKYAEQGRYSLGREGVREQMSGYDWYDYHENPHSISYDHLIPSRTDIGAVGNIKGLHGRGPWMDPYGKYLHSVDKVTGGTMGRMGKLDKGLLALTALGALISTGRNLKHRSRMKRSK